MEQKKIDRAINLIRAASNSLNGEPIEVAYSGGKDSDVILQLTKESCVNYRAIYKATTIDPPGTIQHVKDNGVEIIFPKKNFFELVSISGFPNRFKRFCCDKLKEYKVLDKAIIGVRRSESSDRAARYKEPTQCRVYTKKEKVEQIFPILDWNDEDIEWFIKDRKIKVHDLYYVDGKLDVTKRLGCLGCPLVSTKKRIEYFKQYPNLVKAYCIAGKKYYDTHEKVQNKYSSVYAWFFRELFVQDEKKWQDTNNCFEGFEIDYKHELERIFSIKF